jgi:hypothetical protein
MSNMIHIKGFRPVGAADSGACDRCGTICPKERVLMAAVDQDGLTIADMTESWGKCCAAAHCYGSKSKTNRDRIDSAIAEYQRNKAVEEQCLMARIATDNTYIHVTTTYTPSGYPMREQRVITLNCIVESANKRYSSTNLPIAGSSLMANDEGHMVRISGDRPAERIFFEARGFRTWVRAQVA